MTKLGVTGTIDERIRDSFDFSTCTSNTVSILLVDVTVEYNVSKGAFVIGTEVMPERTEALGLQGQRRPLSFRDAEQTTDVPTVRLQPGPRLGPRCALRPVCVASVQL